MPALTCQQSFQAAQQERAENPLRQGAYKLHEARIALERIVESVDAIREYNRTLVVTHRGYTLLGQCCTIEDKSQWLRGVLNYVARLLGYNILPGIAALTGDGVNKHAVHDELIRAKAAVSKLLVTCESVRLTLRERPIGDFYRRLERGKTDLCEIFEEADRIAEAGLILADW